MRKPVSDQRQGRARRGQRLIAAGADRLRLAVDEIEHAAQEAVVGRGGWAGRHHATSSRRGIQSAGSSPRSARISSSSRTVRSRPGKDGEQVALAGEVEPRDDAFRAMLDQEAMGVVGQRADQLEFVRGEAEALDIIVGAGLGVGHEDLGRRLLDDRAGDPALERVLGALRGEADDAVALADRLLPILDPAHEDVVVERLPAFVDDDDRGACRRAAPRPGGTGTSSPACASPDRRGSGSCRSRPSRRRGRSGRCSLSNSQARSPSPHQGLSRDQRSAACGRLAAAEQLGEVAQPAMLDRLVEIGVDRVLDPRRLVDVGAAGEQRQPVDQELAVDRHCRRAGAG